MGLFSWGKKIIKNVFFNLRWSDYEGRDGDLSGPGDALKSNPVWSAVNLISGAIASLPWEVYRTKEDGAREVVRNAFSRSMRGKINGYQTSDTLKNQTMTSLLLRGKAYLFKLKDSYGNIFGFVPLDPDAVKVELVDQYKIFTVGSAKYTENEIVHVLGMTLDGVSGVSVLEYQAGPINQNQNVRKFGENYFNKGSHINGLIKEAQKPSTDARSERLKSQWENQNSGTTNAGKIPVLPFGYEFQELKLSAKDAVLIEALNLGVLDVARIFNVPPHLLGDLTKSSYSSIEAQGLEFLQFCLMPWIRRIETAINANLFPDLKYFVEFNVNAFARGTLKERYEAYEIALRAPFLTPNEVRRMENKTPLPGGDELRFQLNTAPVNKLKAGPNGKTRGRPRIVKEGEK